MRKILTIALGLIAVGTLVAAQAADAKRKGPPVGIGPKPPVFNGYSWSNPLPPTDTLGPRRHPQPTDPLRR